MSEVIKLKTYGYDYIDKEVKVKPGEEPKVSHWFLTLKADVDPADAEKKLSKTYKQDIHLVLEKEFEIKRPSIPLNPKEDSIYTHEFTEEELARETDQTVDMPIDLNIGDIIEHPMLGQGEVVDYYATEFKPGTLPNSRTGKMPKGVFCYVIAFLNDEYDDEETGKHKRPTRMFTPRSLYEALNRPQETTEQA